MSVFAIRIIKSVPKIMVYFSNHCNFEKTNYIEWNKHQTKECKLFSVATRYSVFGVKYAIPGQEIDPYCLKTGASSPNTVPRVIPAADA